MKVINQVVTDRYSIYNGDACELARSLPDNSIHYGIHSPPFEGLYKFTDSDRDISNNEGESFWTHYKFLIHELYRSAMAGRLHSVHCMQLPTSKVRHGYIGIRDFRGEIVRAYQDAGWIFHSEVCIWKDPVVAQQRTKSLRLLHKQITKDSTMSGMGLADYIVTFRKPGENPEPVDGHFDHYVGDAVDVSRKAWAEQATKTIMEGRDPWSFERWRSIMTWQKYASPVWTDIRQSRTLAYRCARDEKDEAHISPLQLDVIERCLELWSNPGDVVLSPFAGIGSETYCAVESGRRAVGFELKESYWRQLTTNMEQVDRAVTQALESAP